MNERSFSERLKAYRKQKGLTQQQLADLLNISNKSVSRWESEGGYPDIELLAPLAKALGVTVDELLSETPVQRLSAFDWQNMLSFGFAIGGGILFFLLDLFVPTLLCYCIYLGTLGYGVYLQSRYTYRSDWFYRFHLLTNFFVNLSLLSALPAIATAITAFSAGSLSSAMQYAQLTGSGLNPYQVNYFGDLALIVVLWMVCALIVTSVTLHILRKKLDSGAPNGVWSILRDLFPEGLRKSVKSIMPGINENYDFEHGCNAENTTEHGSEAEKEPVED